MRRGYTGLLLLLSFLLASPAWALFNAQVLTGKRDTKFSPDGGSGDTISGNELRAAAHLDPIPLVPVGFGLSLAQTQWDDDSTKMGTTSIRGLDINLEVEAWLPLELAGLVPFAKLGYTVAGAYAFELAPALGIKPTYVYKPSGLNLSVGLKWEFLLRLGVMLEIVKSTHKLEFDKISDQGNLNLPEPGDVDADNTSILLGIQAGI